MTIYTVIIQGIDYEGHHQNSVENFKTLEEAKNFIDSCIESQKVLEGEDSFWVTEITGSNHEYGWIFGGKIPYGVETKKVGEHKPWDIYKTKRFVIPTIVK